MDVENCLEWSSWLASALDSVIIALLLVFLPTYSLWFDWMGSSCSKLFRGSSYFFLMYENIDEVNSSAASFCFLDSWIWLFGISCWGKLLSVKLSAGIETMSISSSSSWLSYSTQRISVRARDSSWITAFMLPKVGFLVLSYDLDWSSSTFCLLSVLLSKKCFCWRFPEVGCLF